MNEPAASAQWSQAALSAVLYARNLPTLAAFYRDVLALRIAEQEASFARLVGPGVALTLVQAPPHIAEAIVVASPPRVREETPIKLSFAVAGIEATRETIQRLGGHLKPSDAAWAWLGQRHLDGHDPEGNVFQLRQNEEEG